jgi:hypothetical protein
MILPSFVCDPESKMKSITNHVRAWAVLTEDSAISQTSGNNSLRITTATFGEESVTGQVDNGKDISVTSAGDRFERKNTFA